MVCLSRKFLFKSHLSLGVIVSSAKARKGLSCHLKACAILMLFRFNADLKNSPETMEHSKDIWPVTKHIPGPKLLEVLCYMNCQLSVCIQLYFLLDTGT